MSRIKNLFVPTLLVISLTACDSRNWAYSDGQIAIDTQPANLYKPIYMSYEELRQAVKLETDAPLKDFGKIYIYGSYLFINSRNQGIHVYDNANPENPVHLAFLSIPGNVDMAVKGGVLYADSYVDLVAIDLTVPGQPKEIARVTDIFPYNAYQNVPDYISLAEVDSKKGVVIGYE